MNKTLTFARLDFITVKPYLTLKNLIIFLFVFGFIGYGTGEPSMLIGMLMMYGVIYASYPFAVGDKNGIDTLYATLPLTKKNVVAGRYAFILCLNISISAIAFAASAVLMFALGKTFNFAETAVTVLICLILFSIIGAIQLPIFFRLGYAKAKFLSYLPLAAFPAAVAVIAAYTGTDSILPLLENAFTWIQANIIATSVLITAVWVIIMLFSGFLSYRFYIKREF